MRLSWSASAVGDFDAPGRRDDVGDRATAAVRAPAAAEPDVAPPAPPPDGVLPASAP
jgi:hypothetical protein